MTNYTLGSVYDRSKFDVNNEIVPANPIFKAYDNEALVYEERKKLIFLSHYESIGTGLNYAV